MYTRQGLKIARPPEHCEDDLIKSEANARAVGTLVERTSRLVMLVKLLVFKPVMLQAHLTSDHA